ncbi:MAG: hypothetical protein LBF95_01595 [Treponema sp.]|nr:hypothetical protein [Treponema sp.]
MFGRLPLVGLVNIARGEHHGMHLGLANWATGNFAGIQMGLVNRTIGDTVGFQAGLVNTTSGDTAGFQAGLVNTTSGELAGFQVGLINYADSIDDDERSIPIGIISIVRNGGYQAVEYVFSEFYPVQLAVKLGVEKFYTSIIVACNPGNGSNIDRFAAGLGVGSILPIDKSFFLNPEIDCMTVPLGNMRTSLVPFAGYSIGRNFAFTLGPSVTWTHAHKNDVLRKPFLGIYEHIVNSNNSIVVGVRAGIRLRL